MIGRFWDVESVSVNVEFEVCHVIGLPVWLERLLDFY